MDLPKVKTKKLIKEKEFAEVARKVKKSLEEEAQYVFEKNVNNGNNVFSTIHKLS